MRACSRNVYPIHPRAEPQTGAKLLEARWKNAGCTEIFNERSIFMGSVVWYAVVGLLMGLLTNTLLKGGRFGIVGDTSVGVLGAMLGGFLFRYLHGSDEGLLGPMLGAAGGAALLVLDLRLIQKSIAERLRPVFFWGRSPPVFRRTPLVPRLPDVGSELTRRCDPEESDGTVPGITQCSRSNLYRSS